MNVMSLSSPIGILRLVSDGEKLVSVTRHEGSLPCERADRVLVPDAILLEAARQLREYFGGSRVEFDLPISYEGSEFCRAVYKAARQIPYGSTATYREVAEAAGFPGAQRAVGSCLGRNSLLIVVPCHRVVAANGLGGFALGLTVKKFLLGLERKHFDEQK